MVEYNPYAYAIHEDPYPTYKDLRAEAPVYWNEEIGFWAVARHADVLAAFKDVKRLSNQYGVSLEPTASHPQAYITMSFLGMDPPRHDHMRALVSRGFTPRRIADLEGRIRELAVADIDRFIDAGRCDFIDDFAGKLPMAVVSEMLGVPEADRDMLREWADTVVHREDGMFDVPPAAIDASAKMIEYFTTFVAEHRRHPGDDLTGALLDAELDGERLSDEDVRSFLFLMIIAGNETTTKLLGNALYWLWRNPEQRDLVRNDPSLIPRWVEETLRYDPSTQALKRTLATDIELRGQTMREGDKLYLLIGSANRDEDIFPQADTFDIMRDTGAMLSFGHGTHFCLGAALARLEARVVLEEVQARLPDFEILPEQSERIHSINVRGFAKLPIEFDTRTAKP